MELIFCDLDLNLKMYNVPEIYRTKLSNNFKSSNFVYKSDCKNIDTKDFRIYWGNRLPKDFLERFPKLEWIHFGSVGIDRFQSIKDNKKRKILVTNSPNSVTDGMYAHTMFQIFYLLRQGFIVDRMRQSNSLSRENYDLNSQKILNLNELKFLIVGFGNIGSKIANSLKQMGAEVTAIASKERVSNTGINVFTIDKLKDLVKYHNFVIGLLPYNIKLKNIFSEEIFDNMPSNSYFINNGRSLHVNQIHLYEALNKNLSGAAIDVYDDETSKKSNLLNQENLLITPHIGAFDPSYWPEQIKLFEYNLKFFLENKIEKMQNIRNIYF